ncbi:hypothetical protein HYH03_005713 [Edaphochlamys debaryana]|uniref:histidine kinase n=1 Tax=Edaphochlamys debaryana TaxID=47281 RepID=A0A835Y4T1_9CHLO|nr:hypothetical protein HYH03_005713 [Edaphochlamys debaryana]|eukprot:KAG2496110.1 hypothetical protein HYH03_005713 [Edaphochlamys debaryana]
MSWDEEPRRPRRAEAAAAEWTVQAQTCNLLLLFINGVAFATDALLWLRATPVLAAAGSGRPFAPLRYVQWLHSTPTMIYMVALLADVRGRQLTTALAADVTMVLTGLAACYTTGAAKLALATVSFGTFVVAVRAIRDMFEKTISTDGVTPEQRATLRTLLRLLLGLWGAFPAVWLAAEAQALGPQQEALAWGVCDFMAKVVFSSQLWQSNLTSVQSRRDTALEAWEASNRAEAVGRLTALLRQRDDLLSTLSHELRTPLAGVVALAGSVQREVEAALPASGRTLGAMRATAMCMLSIVTSTLDNFAAQRMDSDGCGSVGPCGPGGDPSASHPAASTASTSAVDLRPLAETVTSVLRPLAHEGVEVVAALPEDLPAVAVDATRLSQVLYNLVGNAMRFTHQGEVRVSARVLLPDGTEPRDVAAAAAADGGGGGSRGGGGGGSWTRRRPARVSLGSSSGSSAQAAAAAAALPPGCLVEVRVEDTGVGIPEGQLDDLFLPYRTADRTAGSSSSSSRTGSRRKDGGGGGSSSKDGSSKRRGGGSSNGRSSKQDQDRSLAPGLATGLGGTGLGLYLVRLALRAQGSDIEAESAPGLGSVFKFKLPVARGCAPSACPALPHPTHATPAAIGTEPGPGVDPTSQDLPPPLYQAQAQAHSLAGCGTPQTSSGQLRMGPGPGRLSMGERPTPTQIHSGGGPASGRHSMGEGPSGGWRASHAGGGARQDGGGAAAAGGASLLQQLLGPEAAAAAVVGPSGEWFDAILEEPPVSPSATSAAAANLPPPLPHLASPASRLAAAAAGLRRPASGPAAHMSPGGGGGAAAATPGVSRLYNLTGPGNAAGRASESPTPDAAAQRPGGAGGSTGGAADASSPDIDGRQAFSRASSGLANAPGGAASTPPAGARTTSVLTMTPVDVNSPAVAAGQVLPPPPPPPTAAVEPERPLPGLGAGLVRPNHRHRNNGTLLVLSVDDDPINQLVAGQMLASQSWKVVKAMNGPDALRRLGIDPNAELRSDADGPGSGSGSGFGADDPALLLLPAVLPDLILLDVMMPGMSGFEVCRRVRQVLSNAQLPVIIVSAKGDAAAVEEAFASGADDYMTKPYKRGEMVARIKSQVRVRDDLIGPAAAAAAPAAVTAATAGSTAAAAAAAGLASPPPAAAGQTGSMVVAGRALAAAQTDRQASVDVATLAAARAGGAATTTGAPAAPATAPAASGSSGGLTPLPASTPVAGAPPSVPPAAADGAATAAASSPPAATAAADGALQGLVQEVLAEVRKSRALEAEVAKLSAKVGSLQTACGTLAADRDGWRRQARDLRAMLAAGYAGGSAGGGGGGGGGGVLSALSPLPTYSGACAGGGGGSNGEGGGGGRYYAAGGIVSDATDGTGANAGDVAARGRQLAEALAGPPPPSAVGAASGGDSGGFLAALQGSVGGGGGGGASVALQLQDLQKEAAVLRQQLVSVVTGSGREAGVASGVTLPGDYASGSPAAGGGSDTSACTRAVSLGAGASPGLYVRHAVRGDSLTRGLIVGGIGVGGGGGFAAAITEHDACGGGGGSSAAGGGSRRPSTLQDAATPPGGGGWGGPLVVGSAVFTAAQEMLLVTDASGMSGNSGTGIPKVGDDGSGGGAGGGGGSPADAAAQPLAARDASMPRREPTARLTLAAAAAAGSAPLPPPSGDGSGGGGVTDSGGVRIPTTASLPTPAAAAAAEQQLAGDTPPPPSQPPSHLRSVTAPVTPRYASTPDVDGAAGPGRARDSDENRNLATSISSDGPHGGHLSAPPTAANDQPPTAAATTATATDASASAAADAAKASPPLPLPSPPQRPPQRAASQEPSSADPSLATSGSLVGLGTGTGTGLPSSASVQGGGRFGGLRTRSRSSGLSAADKGGDRAGDKGGERGGVRSGGAGGGGGGPFAWLLCVGSPLSGRRQQAQAQAGVAGKAT